MTLSDLDYVEGLAREGALRGPVLELGTGYGGDTSKHFVERAGLAYVGTDLEPGPGVDVAADFEKAEDMTRFEGWGPFGTVLILNVLEHTFDPIRVLDNALALLAPGGGLVVLTPSIWTLHNYPMDTWRVNPNFYEEYARRRGLLIDERYFVYVGLGPVADFTDASGALIYPRPTHSRVKDLWSQFVHKLANTTGRGMLYPAHLAVAALLRRVE